jgi:DNA-directed RNA polymerase subunit beta'
VVLDDLTARNYDLEGNLSMISDDEMIGGMSIDEGGTRRPPANSEDGGDLGVNEEMSMLDIDDDLLIDDQTEAL